MDKSKIYKRNPNIVTRAIGDEVILVPIKRTVKDLERIYNLNETGKLVWESINGKNTLSQIIGRIVKTFDVKAKQAEEDALKLIEELEKLGCIKSKCEVRKK